jgi:hypothetical protein
MYIKHFTIIKRRMLFVAKGYYGRDLRVLGTLF